MSEIVTMMLFVKAVEGAKGEELEALEGKIAPAREKLLKDPLTAWALHFLAANRMKRALQSIHEDRTTLLDFVRASALVRPFPAVIAEMKADEQKRQQLQNAETFAEKATRQMLEANNRFGSISGSPLDNPDKAVLENIAGIKTPLFAHMGETFYGELLRDFLSISAKPGLQLKLVPIIVTTLQAVDAKTHDYQRWQSARDNLAKGTPRFGGILWGIFGNIVDHEKLATIDKTLEQMRNSTPMIIFCEVYGRVAQKALAAHGISISTDATWHDLEEAWRKVEKDNQTHATLTAKHLTTVKAVQNEAVTAGSSFAAAAADDGSAIIPTGGLLTQRDIKEFGNRRPPHKKTDPLYPS
ncbi:MAG: hypothetical protein L6Q57_02330 [Alphaproteobacteria bacterium]|nr:hypothetical protein [Alphaproteobacteria bacterium]